MIHQVEGPTTRGVASFVVLALVLVAVNCSAPIRPLTPPSPTTAAAVPLPVFGQRIKTSGCQARGALPDRNCTPGAILAGVSKDQLCQSGYSIANPNLSTAERNQVFAEYDVTAHPPGAYIVDHLISMNLGGANDIANLWPEPADPRPGFHEKDQVENALHAQVCAGTIALADAQRQIATNWLDVYNRH